MLLERRVGRHRRVEQQHAAGQQARLEAARAAAPATAAAAALARARRCARGSSSLGRLGASVGLGGSAAAPRPRARAAAAAAVRPRAAARAATAAAGPGAAPPARLRSPRRRGSPRRALAGLRAPRRRRRPPRRRVRRAAARARARPRLAASGSPRRASGSLGSGPASSAAASSSASIASTTLSGVIGASGAGPPRSMPCSCRNARTASAVVSSWWAIQASVEPSCAHARMRLSCGLRAVRRRDMAEILCDPRGGARAARPLSRTASGRPRARRSRSPPRPPAVSSTNSQITQRERRSCARRSRSSSRARRRRSSSSMSSRSSSGSSARSFQRVRRLPGGTLTRIRVVHRAFTLHPMLSAVVDETAQAEPPGLALLAELRASLLERCSLVAHEVLAPEGVPFSRVRAGCEQALEALERSLRDPHRAPFSSLVLEREVAGCIQGGLSFVALVGALQRAFVELGTQVAGAPARGGRGACSEPPAACSSGSAPRPPPSSTRRTAPRCGDVPRSPIACARPRACWRASRSISTACSTRSAAPRPRASPATGRRSPCASPTGGS